MLLLKKPSRKLVKPRLFVMTILTIGRRNHAGTATRPAWKRRRENNRRKNMNKNNPVAAIDPMHTTAANRIINLTTHWLRPAFAAAALTGLLALSVSAADK